MRAEHRLIFFATHSRAIHQAIWLYLRFTLSFRDVEDLLAELAFFNRKLLRNSPHHPGQRRDKVLIHARRLPAGGVRFRDAPHVSFATLAYTLGATAQSCTV
jgi:hypothetical protein